jgi:hypothetical protein
VASVMRIRRIGKRCASAMYRARWYRAGGASRCDVRARSTAGQELHLPSWQGWVGVLADYRCELLQFFEVWSGAFTVFVHLRAFSLLKIFIAPRYGFAELSLRSAM